MNDTPPSSWLERMLSSVGRHLLASQASQTRAFRAEIEELRAMTQRLANKVEELTVGQKQIERVLANQKIDEKFRQTFRLQMSSLIRAQYLATQVPASASILARRFRLRSQHEEDGIILALLEAVGVSTRRFVEIGSGGSGGNSAVLAHDMGWSGLMVDINPRAVKAARHEFRVNPGVTVVEARVEPTTVNTLLRQHGYEGDVDLLSIDVDSIDYWLLRAIDACRARVLVLEYNAHFGPKRAVTLPEHPPAGPTPVEYFGASLAALEGAARARGYRLVLCEPSGVNAFFVRRDLAPAIPTLPAWQAYRPFRHRLRDDTGTRSVEEVFELLHAAGLPLVDVSRDESLEMA